MFGTGYREAPYALLDMTSVEEDTDFRDDSIDKTVQKFFGRSRPVLFKGENESLVKLLTEVIEDWITDVIQRISGLGLVYSHHEIQNQSHSDYLSVAVQVFRLQESPPPPPQEIKHYGNTYVLKNEFSNSDSKGGLKTIRSAYARLRLKFDRYVFVSVVGDQETT